MQYKIRRIMYIYPVTKFHNGYELVNYVDFKQF